MAHEDLTQSSPHAEATEQELVQRVQAGDATAFDTLFRQCCSKVFHQATRFLGNAAEAEEVVQEVFLAKRRLSEADLYEPPLTNFGRNAVERFFTPSEIKEIVALAEHLAA